MFARMLLTVLLSISVLGAQERTPSITIYNSDLALVRESRTLNLQKSGNYAIPDISDEIIVNSVHIAAGKNHNAFTIVEQNFDYDLASVRKILKKSLELPIEVETGGKIYRGILLGFENDLLTLKTEEGLQIIKWKNSGEINLKKLPDNLIVKPTLTYQLLVHKKGTVPVELSYLTRGFSWEVSYVGYYDPDKSTMELNSWADIHNNTSVSFPNSKLYLLAGEVNRADNRNVGYDEMNVVRAMKMKASPKFEEQSVFEYHMYSLNIKTDLKSKQQKQIAFLNPTIVPVQKEFRFDGWTNNKNVDAFLIFKNKKENGLGMALPAGVFRIYQNVGGVKQFIGEDRISHTPRNEEISLKMGTAFDLKAERNVVQSTKISNRGVEEVIEIELRNNKEKEKVEIKVFEHPSATQWEIVKSNFPYKKKSQRTVIFTIPVPADSKVKLRYKIKREW